MYFQHTEGSKEICVCYLCCVSHRPNTRFKPKLQTVLYYLKKFCGIQLSSGELLTADKVRQIFANFFYRPMNLYFLATEEVCFNETLKELRHHADATFVHVSKRMPSLIAQDYEMYQQNALNHLNGVDLTEFKFYFAGHIGFEIIMGGEQECSWL